MNRAFGAALFIAGVVLLIVGILGSSSFSDQVSNFFTGKPTDKTIWLLVAGAAAAVAGVVMTSMSSQRAS
jgi:hypothetical protein